MEKKLPLTRDQEADLIVEKLKKTDVERKHELARKKQDWVENELRRIVSKEIADEIDKEVLNKLKLLNSGV